MEPDAKGTPRLPNMGLSQDEHQARYTRLLDSAVNDRTGFVGAVIGAAFMEHYLRATIKRSLGKYADRFLKYDDLQTDKHYDTSVLLKFAYALGAIDEERYKMFNAFSDLRNAFAHNPDEYIHSSANKKRLKRILTAWQPTSAADMAFRNEMITYFSKPENLAEGVYENAFESLVAIARAIANYSLDSFSAAEQLVTPALMKDAIEEARRSGADRSAGA